MSVVQNLSCTLHVEEFFRVFLNLSLPRSSETFVFPDALQTRVFSNSRSHSARMKQRQLKDENNFEQRSGVDANRLKISFGLLNAVCPVRAGLSLHPFVRRFLGKSDTGPVNSTSFFGAHEREYEYSKHF